MINADTVEHTLKLSMERAVLLWQEHPIAVSITAFFTLYTIYGAIWRLYLSPLAKFPGPKLAALTLWVEFYYDVYLNGQYTAKLIKWHEKYGPIIRISPWELHCADHDFYEEIYASTASGKKRYKYPWFSKSFGLDLSGHATHDHDLHRVRRTAINPFFSVANVRKLQPVVMERVDQMMKRMDEFKHSGEVLNISWMFAAYTNDVLMQYAFARCDHRLEAPDFDPSYRDAAFFGSTSSNALKHAPWLNTAFQVLPDALTRLSNPAFANFIDQKRNTVVQITSIINGTNKRNKGLAHSTIFHEILNSKLPDSEKTVQRLSDEAEVIQMAGTLTTAWIMELSTFWMIRKPYILRKLKAELKANIPDPNDVMPIMVLEQLQYLNAVIKETLRLSYGVAGRLARMSKEPMYYTDKKTGKTWVVPPMTPIGMSNVQLHHDETIFPNSHEFIPERWLNEDGTLNIQLDKYLHSFQHGSRQCLGMALSYSELYSGMSKIWRIYGSKAGVTEFDEVYEGVRDEEDVGVFELYKTGLVDVEWYADSFLPLVKPGSVGIRVRILP